MNSKELNEACAALHEEDRAFFERAFENVNPPPDIRKAAERIVRAFGIRGICDPGWIANIIAFETGRGDGRSHFTPRSTEEKP